MHEMDAVRCKEWRIFPGLSLLEDKAGMIVFIFLHLPLFYWFAYEISTSRQSFITGFSAFLIIHLLLHVLFLWHKSNEFKDWISWTIIIGAAVSGIINLTILLAL
jgi:uncharacterized membrane protein (DUF106 family)